MPLMPTPTSTLAIRAELHFASSTKQNAPLPTEKRGGAAGGGPLEKCDSVAASGAKNGPCSGSDPKARERAPEPGRAGGRP
ncbi:hypothetical protein [Nannocystis pusilla]|uniref:hypothetical protein n=1 Tax=Nannocystis pusilla TaxID=889268 RepID=UPI003B7C0D08